MLTEIPNERNWPLDLDLFTQRHLCVFQTQEQILPAAGGVVLLQHALQHLFTKMTGGPGQARPLT